MKKTKARAAAMLFFITLSGCTYVYNQSITPVKNNLYCISAVIDGETQGNAVMSELARQCCPGGYDTLSQTQNVTQWGEHILFWHIECTKDK